MSPVRGFASDNAATVHTEVLDAIAAANTGHVFGYGHDAYTQEVERRVAEAFGGAAGVFFVFNGSAANVLSLRACCRPWHAAICTQTAHINTDECGAPEAMAGLKLLGVATPDGKLTPELVAPVITRLGDEHAVQPRVVSISQSTELGSVYTPDEIAALATLAHTRGLLLHVDGARLANAAAALGVSLAALIADAGVDILSFGGTKNGLLGGEAVVIFAEELAEGFEYLRKQSLQLASKMRFLAAQFDALLAGELWLRNARHANEMAARLADAVSRLPGLTVTRPVEANSVFAVLPSEVTAALQEQFDFYVWDEAAGEVRWMCAWDTTPEDVDVFAAAVSDALAARGYLGSTPSTFQ
jgi:threonine aldolase